MDRRNLVLGAIAGILILVAIVYTATRKGTGADLPTKFRANCVCMECRRQVRIEAKVVERGLPDVLLPRVREAGGSEAGTA